MHSTADLCIQLQHSTKNISLGNNVRIDDFVIIIAVNGKINIGNNVHIGSYNYINGSGGVDIGNYCNFSQI